MKHILKKIWGGVELTRYKILARDSHGALLYRFLIKLLYPILSSRCILSSRIINYRNRENKNLYEQVKEAAHNDNLLKKDLVLCYFYYHIVPWEYKLYQFASKTHHQRLKYLSDSDRYMCSELVMGVKIYEILKDKYQFYNLLKPYYKRPILNFSKECCRSELNDFLSKIDEELFIKPRNGSLGRDTFIVTSLTEKEVLYDMLSNMKGEWLIEGAIKQSLIMSEWNQSSVNTLRIPSFRFNNQVVILQPFFRTGRKGQIVDNAGAGGILAVVDAETGIIITDGHDENLNIFRCHPDSNKQYKGWQIPCYSELKTLVKKIHMELPKDFIYVGFDFALTDKGWDLIEGNWGQFVGQIATQNGIKTKFDEYIGVFD